MYKMLIREEMKDISLLSWQDTFEKFLISHPTNLEDCDLFVHILNFLQIYMNIAKQGGFHDIHYNELEIATYR